MAQTKRKPKPKPDDHGRFFHWDMSLPYTQVIAMLVKDYGNGLPIGILCAMADPPKRADVTMSVKEAVVVHRKLGEAIEIAKAAGLEGDW